LVHLNRPYQITLDKVGIQVGRTVVTFILRPNNRDALKQGSPSEISHKSPQGVKDMFEKQFATTGPKGLQGEAFDLLNGNMEPDEFCDQDEEEEVPGQVAARGFAIPQPVIGQPLSTQPRPFFSVNGGNQPQIAPIFQAPPNSNNSPIVNGL
jgi:hypothetical protein